MGDISEQLDQIWEKDLLDRRKDAEYLGNYLSKRFALKPDEPGFVLAVDGEWGFGKSFMIQRWQKQFALQDYPTVFFNAWENDYTDDPLLAFIAELNSGLEEFFEHVPKIDGVKSDVKQKLKKAFVPVIKAAGLAIAKKTIGIGIDEIRDAFDEAGSAHSGASHKFGTEDLKEISKRAQVAFEKALESHKTTKSSIADFKFRLSGLITALKGTPRIQLPVFIFVDELDRCRPDYAIELLEGIKHLFGVPGVYFVVATNTIQLGESIRAVYGNGFDGQRYLKRFFDLQYSLIEPSSEQFSRALFAEMNLPSEEMLVHGTNHLSGFVIKTENQPLNETLIAYVLSMHSSAFGIGLRDQKQIANMLEGAFINLKNERIHIFFLVFLAVVYHQDLAAFNRLSKSGVFAGEIFEKIKGNSEQTKIRYEFYGRMRPDPDERRVGVMDIADVYIGNLSLPSDQISRLSASADDFPRCLLTGVAGTSQNGMFRPIFHTYFDVVRQAGGFTGR